MKNNAILKLKDFAEFYSGKNIRVAFIDNGINTHLTNNIEHYTVHNGSITKITEHENQLIAKHHGTICCNKLLEVSPDVIILDLNILNEDLKLTEENLIIALEWLLQQEIDVINISMGLYKFSVPLYNVCKKLRDNNVIINAANETLPITTYPADFDCTIKIDYKNESTQEEYIVRTGDNEFLVNCHGVVDIEGEVENGTSLATALFSGYCALFMESRPLWSKREIVSYFFNKKNVDFPHTLEWKRFYEEKYQIETNFASKDMLYINDYELSENSLMALLSSYDNYNKYNHLLNHKIRGVYDLQNKEIVWSRDENSTRAYQKMYVVNEDHFNREATMSNTYFDDLVDIKSVEYIGNYDVINNNFKKIDIPWKNKIEIITTPIIVIAGIGPSCGKFATQLELLNSFHQNKLLSYNITFNSLGMFYDMACFNYPSKIVYPDMVYMINNYVKHIEQEKDYESIVINIPNGITATEYGDHNFGALYNATISAVDVDLVILCVNNSVLPVEIGCEIGKLEHIGIKNIIIVVSEESYFYRSSGQHIIYSETLQKNEEYKDILQKYFPKIPVILQTEYGSDRLYDSVVKYLS